MARSSPDKNRVSEQQALKLQQSVYQKDFERINKLLANGVPGLVNICDPVEGITAIHIAVCANDVKTIDLLCDNGADCNLTDNQGRTVYMKAAALGHFEGLDLLLKLCEYPDIDAVDSEGRNILYYCLHDTARHELCLKLALECGVDVNVVCNDGRPLLYQCCELKLKNIMTLLLDANIDVNVKNLVNGETCLHIPCRSGDLEMARLLLKHGANTNICDGKGNHCAHKAARREDLEILQLLSAYAGNLGAVNGNLDTPMHTAAQRGSSSVVKFLGQRGDWAMLKNKKGKTPRELAKNSGHKLAMKAAKKAEKNKGDKPGTEFENVRFYDWIQEHSEELATQISKSDRNETGKVRSEDIISALKKDKSLPLPEETLNEILHLHDPLYEGFVDFEVLVSGKKVVHKSILNKTVNKSNGGKSEGGGKKGGRGKEVKTKVHFPICTNVTCKYVRAENGGPFVNYIQKQQLVTDRTRFDRDHQPKNQLSDDSYWYQEKYVPDYIHINDAVKNDDKESLAVALRNGYNVNGKDQYYKTPLMHACLDGNYKLVQFLLENGAHVNETDNFQWSAIHFACHSAQLDIVELLIAHGADINSATLNGGVPLMRAIESSALDVVLLLLDNDAKVHVETKKGLKPLDVAKAYSDERIIDLIEKRITEVPPPIVQRKRKFSPIKGKPSNKVGSSSPVTLPDIKQQEVIKNTATSSLLNSVSGMEKAADAETSLSFQVQKAWLPQLNTQQMMSEKEKQRERFGCEVDFEDYKTPFQSHIVDLVSSMDNGK